MSLVRRLHSGDLSPQEFVSHIAHAWERSDSLAELCAATVDLGRRRRCGFPEVVFGPGKTVQQLREIFATLLKHGEPVLATRIVTLQAVDLLKAFPTGRITKWDIRFGSIAKLPRVPP